MVVKIGYIKFENLEKGSLYKLGSNNGTIKIGLFIGYNCKNNPIVEFFDDEDLEVIHDREAFKEKYWHLDPQRLYL